jgi:hypothetical protein
LRIPRRQARVRRLFFGGCGWNSLLARRQMSCIRFGCQVGPGLWFVACALAASSWQLRRSSAFSFAGLADDLAVIIWHGSRAASFWISVLLILGPFLGFASTADAPRCHHFALLFRSASTLSRLHDFTTSRLHGAYLGGVYFRAEFTFAASTVDLIWPCFSANIPVLECSRPASVSLRFCMSFGFLDTR